MEANTKAIKLQHKRIITVASIAIPLVVALLFGVKLKNVEPLTFLPPVYATINAVTSVILVLAVIAVKNKNIILHKRLIAVALFLSVVFLALYVAYHMTSDSTSYGGEYPWLYYPVLISHIILSVGIIPLVLITVSRGLLNNVEQHRKIAKITFPLWLYVAISGVVVYIMISPFYN